MWWFQKAGILGLALSLSVSVMARNAGTGFKITTIAGGVYAGDGGAATSAPLSYPNGIGVDVFGNVFVADAGDHRLRKITPEGQIFTVAGTGIPGDSGDGGPAEAAQLSTPYGLAVEPGGAVIVADLGNGKVRRIDHLGRITTLAGGGTTEPGDNAIPALEARLQAPRNVAYDTQGNVYVSDFYGHRVYRISPSGTLTPVAGSGAEGLDGDGGLALKAKLRYPAGIALDRAGALYIVDTGNKRIRKVVRGTIVSLPETYPQPVGISFDPAGILWVADSSGVAGNPSNPGIRVLSARDIAFDTHSRGLLLIDSMVRSLGPDGVLEPFAGTGDYYAAREGEIATQAHLRTPAALTLDGAGGYFIAEEMLHRIRHVDKEGIVRTVAGMGLKGDWGDGRSALLAQLNRPRGIAFDRAGNLYISDQGNNRVRRVTADGRIFTLGQLKSPDKLVLDGDGILYAAETGANRIVKRIQTGAWRTVAEVEAPVGIALDSHHNLYTISEEKVVRLRPTGEVDILSTPDALPNPVAVAVDSQDQLFVTSAATHTIWRILPSGPVAVIAGTGVKGFSEQESALESMLDTPSDILVWDDTALLVADTGNQRVRLLTSAGAPAPLATLAMVNAASLAEGAVAPGELVRIPLQTQPDLDVRFDGIPAQIVDTQADGLLVQVPTSLTSGSTTKVEVRRDDILLSAGDYAVAASAPGLYTIEGRLFALNLDGSLNSPVNPGTQGDVITLFGTGEGTSSLPFSLLINGVEAEILFAGPAPGLTGLFQVNARIPGGFLPSGVLPVVLSVGTAQTQTGLCLWIR